MANGINTLPTGGSLISSLLGGSGSLGTAANQIWQNGQFMPYNLQLPGSTLNFNGNTATGALSGSQQGIQNSYLSQLSNAMAGANYNPTASLGGALSNFQQNVGSAPNLTQYGNVNTAGNSLVGASQNLLNNVPNFNQSVQSNYNSLVNSQMPFLQQATMSNLDNEFAKGTLASTAGAYQTAGQNLGIASTLGQDYGQAFNQAINAQNSTYQNAIGAGQAGSGINLQQGGLLGNLASTQFGQNLGAQQALFGAAGQAANLQEQQSEFGPQFSQAQANSAFSNIMNQNQQVANQVQTGGNLGQQQSTANTNASMPFLQAGQVASQGQSGLLNSLLFGNGSGSNGLLASLLGGSYSGGGAAGLLGNLGNSLGNLFSGGTGVNSSNTNGSLTLAGLQPSGTDYGNPSYNYAGDFSGQSGNDLITQGSDIGNINWGDGTAGDQSNLGGSFSSAGGQAATPEGGSDLTGGGGGGGYLASEPQMAGLSTNASQALQDASGTVPQFNMPSTTGSLSNGIGAGMGALNLIQGINKGGASGALQAAGGANRLANSAGYNTGAAGKTLGAAGNAMGIYNGIQQGGVAGYGSAAVNAGQLAENMGAISSSSALGEAIPVAGAALSVYNFANNWKSGSTGSDAANGAAAGAAIGSIVPGIGTAIGAVIGGAVGALSSAFGGGAVDPESSGVQNVINATSQAGNNSAVAAQTQNPYLGMAGLFDRHDSTLPMYQEYGRMGESKFANGMINQINNAYNQGTINKNSTPDQVYNSVVAPWINSMGSGYSNTGDTYTATTKGLVQDMVSQYMNGSYKTAWKAIGGQDIAANAPAYGSGQTATTDGTYINGGSNSMAPTGPVQASRGNQQRMAQY